MNLCCIDILIEIQLYVFDIKVSVVAGAKKLMIDLHQ